MANHLLFYKFKVKVINQIHNLKIVTCHIKHLFEVSTDGMMEYDSKCKVCNLIKYKIAIKMCQSSWMM